MDFLPLPQLPSSGTVVTSSNPHSRYYHSFRHPLFLRHHHPITHISFSPSKPHRFAVTSSSRVLLYAPKTGKVVKTITRFKETARGAEIRADGKLMCAGGDDGVVQVFDLGSRAILRTLKEHTKSVHVTRFSPDNTHLLSASDDLTLRLWDIPSGTSLATFASHTDYIRSASFIPSNPSLFLSGSYDSTLRLWDSRLPSPSAPVITMKHGSSPVENLLAFPSGDVVMSVGGQVLRVWDLASGGKCVRALSNHQKTITCLSFDGENRRRVLTGGLDQMVKVYDLEDWSVVHSMRYPAPILCLAVSPDDTHIAAGMSDGTLSLRRRDPKVSEASAASLTKATLGSGSYEYFAEMETVFASGHVKPKAGDLKPEGAVDELRVERVRRRRLRDYEKFLKGFKYGAALDAVMVKSVKPATAFALIQELIYRDGLRIALGGRDDLSLEPVLRFLSRSIVDPRFGEMAAEVAEVVIDMYTAVLGQSQIVDDIIAQLRRRVDEELRFQKDLVELRGALDMVLAQAALSQSA